jgi:hypothetical protein
MVVNYERIEITSMELVEPERHFLNPPLGIWRMGEWLRRLLSFLTLELSIKRKRFQHLVPSMKSHTWILGELEVEV